MTSADFDLLVVGGGPGGFDAALKAAGLGLNTALVEKDLLGGACLNRGCIPTKLFLGASRPVAELDAQRRLRLARGEVGIDLPALQERKRKLLSGSRSSMHKRLEAAGVELISGRGEISGPKRVKVTQQDGERELGFHRLVLATGSRPGAFPGMEPDGEAVLDSDMLLEAESPPGSLGVIGGGAIGLEMAEFFHRLGAKITIVEALERLAPWEDPEVSKVLAKAAGRRKWEVRLETRVKSLVSEKGRAVMTLENEQVLDFDKALVAVGRLPNSAGLGLEKAGIETDKRGFVITDEHLLAAEDVYAVGDVNGRTMLAHAASHQGEYAAAHAAGKDKEIYNQGPVPWCIWGSLETLRVGPSAEELSRAGKKVSAGQAMLAANPMVQASGETQGFVRVVWDGERAAGVHAVGHGATHLSTQARMIVENAWTREQAEDFMFAHPTLDESLKQALLAERLEY